MKPTTILAVLAPLALMAACASRPLLVTQVPDNLRPAQGEVFLRTVFAAGVQTYECRASKAKPGTAQWAFVAPIADLLDDRGKLVGTHFAGPRWKSVDGSEIAGTVKASAIAPQDAAIPWLLLTTRSVGTDGAFARVTSIQRINTVGGTMPPGADCRPERAGTVASIPYNADYAMFGRSAK